MWPPANPFIFLFNCIVSAVCSFPFGFTLSLENLEPWNYEIEKFLQSRADLIYTKEDGTEFWRWEWNFGGHACCKESGPGNSSISTYSDFADLEWDSDSGIFWKAFQMILTTLCSQDWEPLIHTNFIFRWGLSVFKWLILCNTTVRAEPKIQVSYFSTQEFFSQTPSLKDVGILFKGAGRIVEDRTKRDVLNNG